MVDVPTAVVASICGAVVAGVISAIINAYSLRHQFRQNQKHRLWMEKFQWLRETNTIVRQLRREALQMKIDDPDIDVMDELIQDLKLQLDSLPTEYNGTQLDSALNDILIAYHDYDDGKGNIVDLRTKMITATETAERNIENTPNSPNLGDI